MSLLSMIGFILFVFICYSVKNACLPYLYQPEFTYTDPSNGKQIDVPAQPANYLMLGCTLLIGIVFLIFITMGTVQLWNIGPKIVF